MNSSGFMFFCVMILSWALVVFASCMVPFISRKNLVFGVSIPEDEYANDYFMKLRRSYLIISLVVGLILGLLSNLSLLWMDLSKAVWIYPCSIVFYLVIDIYLYLTRYYKVKTYKQKSGWQIENTTAASLNIEKNEKKHLSPWWFLCYLAVIIGTIITTLIRYPNLPDVIPMHYDMNGNVNRFGAKSLATFLDMPVMQLVMGLLFFGIFLAILRAKAQSAGGEINEGLKRDRRFKSIMAAFIFFMGLAVLLLFCSIQLSLLGLISVSFLLVFPVIFIIAVTIAITVLMIKVGQSGSRLRTDKTSVQTTAANDDGNWIGGFLYYNKNDPSLFVEKRFGIGYTLNFGNPKSMVAIIVLILFIAITLILPFVLK